MEWRPARCAPSRSERKRPWAGPIRVAAATPSHASSGSADRLPAARRRLKRVAGATVRLANLGLVAALVAVPHASPAATPIDRAARLSRRDKWLRTTALGAHRIDKDVYVFSRARTGVPLTKDLGILKIVLAGEPSSRSIHAKFSWPSSRQMGVGRASAVRAARPLLGFTGAINVAWQVDLARPRDGCGTFGLRISEKIETVAAGSGQRSTVRTGLPLYSPDAHAS